VKPKKWITFKIKVPTTGTDGQPLDPRVVKEYIKDAIESWSGQFDPSEDNMFYWAKNKTKVTRVRA
jgi:hypothetical protein